MHTQTRLPTISKTQQDVINQLREQNANLVASLKKADEDLKREQSRVNLFIDALLEPKDQDRRMAHVLDVLSAIIVVVAAVRRDPEQTQTEREALAELDRVRGTAK